MTAKKKRKSQFIWNHDAAAFHRISISFYLNYIDDNILKVYIVSAVLEQNEKTSTFTADSGRAGSLGGTSEELFGPPEAACI